MALRTKTLAVIGTTLVLMIALISSISRVIVLGGYERLERQSILQNVEQAVRMIDDELAQVKSVVGDWAPWDETYQFVQDGNQDYIDNNLAESTIINLPIDFLIYLNSTGEMVRCAYVDPATGEGAQCPQELIDFARENRILYRSDDRQETLRGVRLLPDNPVLLAVGPILTSKFEGPVMGTLMAGRYLSEREVQRLAEKVSLSIRIQPLEGEQLPRDVVSAKQLLSGQETTAVDIVDDNTIAAYTVLNDLQGKPILMLGIDSQRRIYAQGKANLVYFLAAICAAGLVFIVATLLFIESKVLSRIVRLNHEVEAIGRTGDLAGRTFVEGRDELAGLATAINEMLESVRVSTERDRAILESMDDGYFELDLEGRLTFYNRSLARLFEYTGRDLHGMDYRHLLNRSSARQTFEAMKQLYGTGRSITSMETGFTLPGGREIFLESTISLIRDADGKAIGFRGITRDVTERKRVAEKLLHLAYHDALTGLLNRKAFYQHLHEEIEYARRYDQQRSLLFVDLDKFKLVNDQFGHATGDELLKEFTGRALQVVRSTDRFFRLGGDEFVILLSEPHSQYPEVVAERLLEQMKSPFTIGPHTISCVTASIGISIFPQDGGDADTLLHKADTSMYAAKMQGGAGARRFSDDDGTEPGAGITQQAGGHSS